MSNNIISANLIFAICGSFLMFIFAFFSNSLQFHTDFDVKLGSALSKKAAPAGTTGPDHTPNDPAAGPRDLPRDDAPVLAGRAAPAGSRSPEASPPARLSSGVFWSGYHADHDNRWISKMLPSPTSIRQNLRILGNAV